MKQPLKKFFFMAYNIVENFWLIKDLFGFVFLVCFLCPSQQSYGHVGTVSSPNHTFFLGKLD